jgi:nitroimidazol reductase NimA-like FMN-containing flavoprotein (pyridoxamine 5'-phosphate oxidase superfamily)
MTVPDDARLQELDDQECRRLLGSAVIGRIAFSAGARPAIQPVPFTLRGGHVYIPTRPGSKVAAATANSVVAFEADSFDPQTHVGWSVTTIGPARLVTRPEDLAALRLLGLEPWAATPDPCFIAVRTSIWHGRRLFSRPADRVA